MRSLSCGWLHIVERDRLAGDQQSGEPFLRKPPIAAAMRRRLRLALGPFHRFARFSLFVRHFRHLVDFDRRRRRRGDYGRVETDEQTGSGWQFAKLPRDYFGRFADDLAAAVAAERAPDARVQQAHVVVDFRRRPDRRARVADAVLLTDRDRRRDAVDAIDVRLLHPLEELPRVGG